LPCACAAADPSIGQHPHTTLRKTEVIARLKSEPGKNIVKYGTTRLDRTLFEHRLVDELHLWYFPVVVGRGRRLFEDIDTSGVRLELVDIHRFKSGIVKHMYAVRHL
jgi:dihydrofolate reductase